MTRGFQQRTYVFITNDLRRVLVCPKTAHKPTVGKARTSPPSQGGSRVLMIA